MRWILIPAPERASCRPAGGIVFPRADGEPWNEHDYGNWLRRVFGLSARRVRMTCDTHLRLAADLGRAADHLRPATGHSPPDLPHDYAHVMEGVEANVPAETVIRAARASGDELLASGS